MGLLKDVIMPGIGAMRKKKQDSSGPTSRPGKVGGYSQEDESGSTQSFKRGGKAFASSFSRRACMACTGFFGTGSLIVVGPSRR